ncbi:Protein ENL [Camelus dromedarius]|uniref:Protein ENL n=1 Tax=Camelus dromedarius TaxID=9838 RepID=A0A5N4CJS7_CAMDR|nr:Protein ENL [Camelus dromedarius]
MDEETGTEKQPPARPSEPTSLFSLFKEEPRKVCFTYDLFLNLEGNPPVNHLRCEKLTFNNPTIEFRYKLLMAGGVMVMPEGAETVSRPSPDYPMLPTIPLSAFSDPKKTKPSHGSKDASRESSKACKAHKTTKEHRERPRKDSESRGPSKEPEREQARSAKDAARKLGEGRPPKEEKAPPPKAAFKEPKMALKETKLESMSPKGGPPPPPPPKSSSKRPAAADSPKPSAKKQKKSSSKGSRSAPSTSPRTSSSSFSDKKPAKDKGSAKGEKVKAESEPREIKKPPEVEESNSEDEASFKTESAQSSPSNSSSSSDSSSDSDFEPSQNHSQGQGLEACEQGQEGPLRSMVEDLQSEESDEDDSSSGEEAAGKTNAGRDSREEVQAETKTQPGPCATRRRGVSQPQTHRFRVRVRALLCPMALGSGARVTVLQAALPTQQLSFSDSESDNSADSCLPGREPPPPKKPPPPNSKQASGRRSPEPCSKPEKILKRGAYDKVGAQAVMGTGCGAYTDELVELHRRLMALRERNVLQQIVNLIEETGHFNVTNTTFDFDLFSLDETTVRKLQSCLEAVAT